MFVLRTVLSWRSHHVVSDPFGIFLQAIKPLATTKDPKIRFGTSSKAVLILRTSHFVTRVKTGHESHCPRRRRNRFLCVPKIFSHNNARCFFFTIIVDSEFDW